MENGIQLVFWLDVGTNVGSWSTAISELYPNAKFLMLIGTHQNKEKLKIIASKLKYAESRIGLTQPCPQHVQKTWRVVVCTKGGWF